MAPHGTPSPDPYAVLGVPRDATQADITAAYRRLVRTVHPDADQPDSDRLAAVLAAYQTLRDADRRDSDDRVHPERQPSPTGVTIPVRVHQPKPSRPDFRAGPVRHHPR